MNFFLQGKMRGRHVEAGLLQPVVRATEDSPTVPFDKVEIPDGKFAVTAGRLSTQTDHALRTYAEKSGVALAELMTAAAVAAMAKFVDDMAIYFALRTDGEWRPVSANVRWSCTLTDLAQQLAKSIPEDGPQPRQGISVSRTIPSDFGDMDLVLHISVGEDIEVAVGRRPAISETRAQAMAQNLMSLLQRLATDPDSPLAALWPPAHDTSGALPDPQAPLTKGDSTLIHHAWLEIARRWPERTAIVDGDGGAITYGEIELQTRAVAGQLHAAGVRSGGRVAIIAARSARLVATMLGAVRLGATFVVLDSSYPEQRLAQLIEIANVDAIAGDGRDETITGLIGRLKETRGAIRLDLEGSVPDAIDSPTLDSADPDQPAYFLFTSGSTGTPKCVACSHRPLVNFVSWQSETFELGETDRFTMLSGLSHDPLLRDVFTPLSIGATLLIPRQEEIFQPGQLATWFVRNRPTVAHMTPAMGQLLTAAARDRAVSGLRWIFWGGDLLRPPLLEQVRRVSPETRSVNFYGSTETPQAAAWFAFDDDFSWRTVPVGKGARGFQILIVDKDRRQKGVGEVGEIAVRSNFLSLGYVEGGRLKAREGAGDIYYTGDRGYYLPDGNVQVLGRQDDQIKVRGYRVDLSEVTATLLSHPNVQAAIALPSDCRSKVHAFIVADAREPDVARDVADLLGERLPGYMTPTSIERLDAMPLLPNGKIDRATLRARLSQPLAQAAPIRAASPTEIALINRWSSVLGRNDLTPTSSFVSVGGDSLSYVQLYLATEQAIGAVPVGWHLMSLSEIARAAAPKKRFFSDVDTSMIIRAISISLVVAGHFGLLMYGGGATSALFLVSGFMIGDHQLWEVFSNKTVKPILRLLLNVTIPVALFSYALFLLKVATGHQPSWSLVLFDKNFFRYTPTENQFFLWYIHCMMQILLILCVSILAVPKNLLVPERKWVFLVVSFAVACIFRYAFPLLVFPDYPAASHDPLHVVNLLPTTHYATLVLGAMTACADTARRRAFTIAAALIYAAATYLTLEVMSWLFILISAITLLNLRRLPVPKLLGRVIFMLSGGSLFIYLTHYYFRLGLKAVGAPPWPLVHTICALAGGIIVWMAWNSGQAFVTRLATTLYAPAAART
jgi:amino acid adenylation domain-containing protein